MENEHSTYSVKGGSSGGSVAGDFVHKEGSGRGYYASSAPTVRPDGATALGTSDDGRIWVDSDDKIPYVWTGSAWTPLLATATALNGKAIAPASVAATGAVSGTTITGTGNVTGAGFTTGDVVLKFKQFTGTTAATSETSFTHGLTVSKIVGAFILINYNGISGYWSVPDTTNNTAMMHTYSTTFTFYHPSTSPWMSRSYKVVIMYEA